MRFENNFLAERTNKLEAELFQVKAQLERTSNAKLDEMLNFQKSASDKTGMGNEFSISPNIVSSSKTVFVSPANDDISENVDTKTKIAIKNIDNGKSILRAPLKFEKKETRNPRTKKDNN